MPPLGNLSHLCWHSFITQYSDLTDVICFNFSEVIIGFVESYEVSEGVNLTVPVEVAVVKGVLEKAVVVRVFTANDSAQGQKL